MEMGDETQARKKGHETVQNQPQKTQEGVQSKEKVRTLIVWNVGLPRTGTTSTTAALKCLGLRCVPVVAQWVAQDIKRWDGFERTITRDVPIICTLRDFDSWFISINKYFGVRAKAQTLARIYREHQDWLKTLDVPIGYFRVEDGYGGLFKALAKGYDGVPMQRLNVSHETYLHGRNN